MTPSANAVPPIPIGQYFHIEVYFKRAKDTTGTLTLFQDGVMAVSLTGLVTDPTDWGQWYVGIWANSLTPPGSTIYVDDVGRLHAIESGSRRKRVTPGRSVRLEEAHQPGHRGSHRAAARHEARVRLPGRAFDVAPERDALHVGVVPEHRELALHHLRLHGVVGEVDVVLGDVDRQAGLRREAVDEALDGARGELVGRRGPARRRRRSARRPP